MNRPKLLTRWEALVILAAVAALLVWCFFPKRAGGTVEVSRSGETVLTCPLNTDVTRPLTGVHGVQLTLVVEKGTVRVTDATCPDRLCQRHGSISKEGESIICLPGQLVIAVKGGDALGPDAVSG